MAFASPHITAYAVEATEYPDLARRYRVTGVPKTVVNEDIEILGGLLVASRLIAREQLESLTHAGPVVRAPYGEMGHPPIRPDAISPWRELIWVTTPSMGERTSASSRRCNA